LNFSLGADLVSQASRWGSLRFGGPGLASDQSDFRLLSPRGLRSRGIAEEAVAVATIASLLRDRVTLRVRSVDRLFLQAYVPRLMTSFQVVRFLLDRGFTIPSPALLAKIGRAYVARIDRYAADNAVPVLRFARGESKEQIARR
jgi:hypothetical protein